jgi:hypothetical protein
MAGEMERIMDEKGLLESIVFNLKKKTFRKFLLSNIFKKQGIESI